MCVGAPWEHVAIDIRGPHPLSNKGNKFIFYRTGPFTKFAFAFPLRTHNAHTVAKYLVERVFLTHGVPLQFLSDRGAEFKGLLFREVCEILHIGKIRTTSYKPSTNDALERMRRTLNTMLGKVVEEKQKNWDAHVAYVMAGYNATVHSATGYSPNRLVYGRELQFPNELLYVDVIERDIDPRRYSEFVEEQRKMFRILYALVRNSLGLTDERRKKY